MGSWLIFGVGVIIAYAIFLTDIGRYRSGAAPLDPSGGSFWGIILVSIIAALLYGRYEKSAKAAEQAKKYETERRAREEAQARRQEMEAVARAQEQQRLARDQTEAKRKLVEALPKEAGGKWAEARQHAEKATEDFDRAAKALSDKRPAAFYEGLFGMTSNIKQMTQRVDVARATLLSYDQGRGDFRLPAHQFDDRAFAALVEGMTLLSGEAERMFIDAERIPDYVMIRLHLEGNREAKVFHTRSLGLQEEMVGIQREIAQNTIKMADVLEETKQRLGALEETMHDQIVALREEMQEAAQRQVESMREAAERQIESAREDAQRALEVATAIGERSRKANDMLHDIHGRTVRPNILNKHQPWD